MQMILLIVMLSCNHVITSGTYVKAMRIRFSAGRIMARDYKMRVRSLVCTTINYINVFMHYLSFIVTAQRSVDLLLFGCMRLIT